MNLSARKYNFIQELINVESESIIDALEQVLKTKKEEHKEVSKEHKIELDNRLKSYNQKPNDVLDWKDVKNNW